MELFVCFSPQLGAGYTSSTFHSSQLLGSPAEPQSSVPCPALLTESTWIYRPGEVRLPHGILLTAALREGRTGLCREHFSALQR